MDLNKKNMKRIALLIAFGLLLYWGLNHPGQAGQMLSTVFSIFLPFLLGGCLAFLLNVILRPVERGWRRAWGKRYGPRQKRAQRPVCLLVSTLLLVGVVFAIFFIVVPALKDSVVNFVSLLPSRLTHLEHWWNNLAGFLEAHSIQLPEFSLNSAELQNNITSFLSKYGEDFLNTTIGITSSIFSLVVNLVLALAFSLYLLAQKETLTGQAKKVVRALFSEKWAHWITDVARMTNRTFSNFVTGQLTEAVILGTLCFLGMLIFRLPYAGVISVLVGFTGQSHKSPVVYPLLRHSPAAGGQPHLPPGGGQVRGAARDLGPGRGDGGRQRLWAGGHAAGRSPLFRSLHFGQAGCQRPFGPQRAVLLTWAAPSIFPHPPCLWDGIVV